MENFRINMRNLLRAYERPRPFICDGNPLDCEVFIVGINAATEMENDFWAFWSDHTGFNKQLWLETYILERSLKPLKPNKRRRNKLSNTRQRIEWLVESIKPAKTLETNLFVKPTGSAVELTLEDKETSVFKYLTQTIKPKIIFIHGEEVRGYFEKLYGVKIVHEKINKVNLLGIETNIVSMNHLSRGWSKKKTVETGKLLKQIAMEEL